MRIVAAILYMVLSFVFRPLPPEEHLTDNLRLEFSPTRFGRIKWELYLKSRPVPIHRGKDTIQVFQSMRSRLRSALAEQQRCVDSQGLPGSEAQRLRNELQAEKALREEWIQILRDLRDA